MDVGHAPPTCGETEGEHWGEICAATCGEKRGEKRGEENVKNVTVGEKTARLFVLLF